MERNVADEIAARASSEHGFRHIDHFNNPERGQVLNISTPQELETHVKYVVESPETKCFTAFSTEQQYRKADIFYHEPTNTMVINPYSDIDQATVYRPKEGSIKFEEKYQEAESIEKIEIPVVHGINELHPERSDTPEFAEQNTIPNDGQEPEPPRKGGVFTQAWESSQEWNSANNDYEHNDDIER